MKLIIRVTAVLVFAFCVVPAFAFPLCANLTDTYSLAIADMQGRGPAKWKALRESGDCAEVKGASYILTIDSYQISGESVTRIAQFTILGKSLYGLRAGELPSPIIEARDNGEWEVVNPAEVREWYRKLMQPDYPNTSCCGEADAYHADSFESGPNGYIAIITDDRVIPGRAQVPVGTRVPIPNHKLKYDAGNPTGHGVVFLGSNGQVFCYIAPGGI